MKKTLTAKVLEIVWQNPGSTIKDVAIMLNISLPTARAILYKLKNNGYIEKTGKGYILTSKGEWFINNVLLKEKTGGKESIEQKPEEKPVKTERVIVKNKREAEEDKKEIQAVIEQKQLVGLEEKVMAKIKLLESRINELEKTIQRITADLESIKNMLKTGKEHAKIMEKTEKPSSKPALALGTKKPARNTENKLPAPIMYVYEAKNTLGPLLDSLIRSGKAEIIGSLIVDSEFYKEFKKRFPITISEAERLPPMEKKLLEEMNREAIVIIHAGKYYKLVK
ncbi:winged helix-turn-helix domain-containing protein [Staphylothermus hellenicus]|uniref:Uncharacterized protein n=1 Tax=Staphylothermus hellenicus (strain DSM 12710 / JCM 10830 / BK20S6-10-b1 / P8) TaxID=591019 RepID=D7DC56_STAHD|nr:winged helix-turn-helix transcriptional regulator [Staphylothermus hellenicus]ADI31753.1 hypothetical protein Shell_0629 [Staphylothermus hellenicus DSM 12710]